MMKTKPTLKRPTEPGSGTGVKEYVVITSVLNQPGKGSKVSVVTAERTIAVASGILNVLSAVDGAIATKASPIKENDSKEPERPPIISSCEIVHAAVVPQFWKQLSGVNDAAAILLP